MKRKNNKNRGFSLVEVIISVAIVVILIIPISNVGINAIKTNRKSEQRQKAKEIGQKYLEEFNVYDSMSFTHGTEDFFNLVNGERLARNAMEAGEVYESDFVDSSIGNGLNYNVHIRMERKLDASNNFITASIEKLDYDNIFYLTKDNITSDLVIKYYDPTLDSKELSELDTGRVVSGTMLNYQLRVNKDMDMKFLKEISVDNFSDIGNVIKPVIWDPINASINIGNRQNKLLFVITKELIQNTNAPIEINMEIIGEYDDEEHLNIDLITEAGAKSKLNVYSPRDNSFKGNLRVNLNKKMYVPEDTGNLYNIKVTVRDENNDTLMESSVNKNIIVN